jgi:hypothetical protein
MYCNKITVQIYGTLTLNRSKASDIDQTVESEPNS